MLEAAKERNEAAHAQPFMRMDASVCPHCRREVTAEALTAAMTPKIDVSFREPMHLLVGTTVFKARDASVAVLPDTSLIADDGARGLAFASAVDYRVRTGDADACETVRQF
jgi:hypothetical protein